MLDRTLKQHALSDKPDRLFWRISNIDLDAIDIASVNLDESLLLLMAASSFVESASHIYSRNLVEHFYGDAEISDWLTHQWEPQELQHGQALRAYIAKVWPDFNWERAYQIFYPDYTSYCRVEELEPVRGLELVARCLVETGTATLYRSIYDYARDPVLKTIAKNISSDEVRHYGYFYHFFQKYQLREKFNRIDIFRALLRRAAELQKEDIFCGLGHAVAERYRENSNLDETTLSDAKAKINTLVQMNYPFERAAKMLLKPLALPANIEAILRYPVIYVGRRFIFH
jgi:hypothetical protein